MPVSNNAVYIVKLVGYGASEELGVFSTRDLAQTAVDAVLPSLDWVGIGDSLYADIEHPLWQYIAIMQHTLDLGLARRACERLSRGYYKKGSDDDK